MSALPTLCAIIGCGEDAQAGRIYCGQCRGRLRDPLETHLEPEDRDLHVLTLRERLAGGGPISDSVERHGTGKCLVCQGPTLPGRSHCSSPCRTRARQSGGTRVVVDGVEAPIAKHLLRIGLSKGAFYARLRAGKSVSEALGQKPDEEMRRRAACRTLSG